MDRTETYENQANTLSNMEESKAVVEARLAELQSAFDNYNEALAYYQETHSVATQTFAASYLEDLGFGEKQFIEAQFTKKFTDHTFA